MIRIQYDDREEFPWIVWAGTILWAKYRTRRGALHAKSRLESLVAEVEREAL